MGTPAAGGRGSTGTMRMKITVGGGMVGAIRIGGSGERIAMGWNGVRQVDSFLPKHAPRHKLGKPCNACTGVNDSGGWKSNRAQAAPPQPPIGARVNAGWVPPPPDAWDRGAVSWRKGWGWGWGGDEMKGQQVVDGGKWKYCEAARKKNRAAGQHVTMMATDEGRRGCQRGKYRPRKEQWP